MVSSAATLVEPLSAALVAAPFTAPRFLLLEVLEAFLLVATACFTMFAASGVGWVVQYHVPLASAHACPSLAVPYALVADNGLPNGSSRSAWPLVLLRLRPVSAE